ncbi:transcriptional regulator PadR-like family protein [Rhodococcus sp. MTM3W5.2]|uniref:PadR family transcriptional regulator n=1 Tax=Rhodococcus sp. MTM3W5.2 TaxID=1805827 RepID=UPI000979781E|nr:PadR family transcriptional regulator [Rhodococcus sp. MTM3W5.2]AQA20915.1 transcriptional regulator PadR-like family protein [Rhodococcus sp. MTM3W5.2]
MGIDKVLLGVLAIRPSTGYDLHKWFDGPGRFVGWRAQLPHIYRTLAKLLDQGWVRFEVEERDGKPDAKVYRLTDTGTEALIAWARSPFDPAPRPMDPDFMLRFVFGGQLDREIALAVLRRELAYRREQVEGRTSLTDSSSEIETIPEIDQGWAFQVYALAIERGQGVMDGYLTWLEAALQRLEGESD